MSAQYFAEHFIADAINDNSYLFLYSTTKMANFYTNALFKLLT